MPLKKDAIYEALSGKSLGFEIDHLGKVNWFKDECSPLTIWENS